MFPQERSDGVTSQSKNHIVASAIEICPIKVGERIPEIILTKINNVLFNLNEALKLQQAILVFYRGGWCSYCNRQFEQLRLMDPN